MNISFMEYAAKSERIKKAAVIGSGVMGSGIAGLLASAGIDVILFDIADKDSEDASNIAKNAIARMKKALPSVASAISHDNVADRMQPANLSDDLHLLADVDWIVEVIIEKLEIKQNLYEQIEKYRKSDCIISSNTSTILLDRLVDGRSDSFKKHFAITHFFNPPRHMRLLELVVSKHNDTQLIRDISECLEQQLGKEIVRCYDSPGFIANRIGIYWLVIGLIEAIRLGVDVELADSVMGKPLGIPKTGIFGLFDLIGLDLIPLIADEMTELLPETDAFCRNWQMPDILHSLISDGYTGRKGKGGFYKIHKNPDGSKEKMVLDLSNGEYISASGKTINAELQQAIKSSGIRALFDDDGIAGEYVKAVMGKLLSYAAGLVGEVADDIDSIDRAMKTGYNWRYGIFELIDLLGQGDESGARYIQKIFAKQNLPVPEIIAIAANKNLSFYQDELASENDGADKGEQESLQQNGEPNNQEQEASYYILNSQGEYRPVYIPLNLQNLANRTFGKEPLLSKDSSHNAYLWHIADVASNIKPEKIYKIAALQINTKMNTLDESVFSTIAKSVDLLELRQYDAMIIASDEANFSAGANLSHISDLIQNQDWQAIGKLIMQGQKVMKQMQDSPVKVISAARGIAFGGGCELLLHSDAVIAHSDAMVGLVESRVGLVPGWGGCKEMLLRALSSSTDADEQIEAIIRLHKLLASGYSADSTLYALENKIFDEHKTKIAMQSSSMVQYGVDQAVVMLDNGNNAADNGNRKIQIVAQTLKHAYERVSENITAQLSSGQISEHDALIAHELINILTAGIANDNLAAIDDMVIITDEKLFELELAAFMKLVQEPKTKERIDFMIAKGKPLKN